MKLLQMLQACLEEWARISGLVFILLNTDDTVFVSTAPSGQCPDRERLEAFHRETALHAYLDDLSFHKIMDGQELKFILVIAGKHEAGAVIGELAVCQVESLLSAFALKNDKHTFFQELLSGSLSGRESAARARQLRIPAVMQRVVFLVQTRQLQDENALATVRSIYSSHTRDFVTALPDSGIVIIRELLTTETMEEMAQVAQTLVDMLGAEAMTSAWASYSNPAQDLESLAQAFREAKTAMEIGRIFTPEKTCFGYRNLGIGRLIYQLPPDICEMFVEEVFGKENPKDLDDETLITIRTLFENNLNMSETARQLFVHRNTLVYRFEKLQKRFGLDVRTFEDALTFKLAMMVVDYMRSQTKTRKL